MYHSPACTSTARKEPSCGSVLRQNEPKVKRLSVLRLGQGEEVVQRRLQIRQFHRPRGHHRTTAQRHPGRYPDPLQRFTDVLRVDLPDPEALHRRAVDVRQGEPARSAVVQQLDLLHGLPGHLRWEPS